jgi:hypothetical protein
MKTRQMATLVAVLGALAGSVFAQPEVPLSTGFTYQGQLKNGGVIINALSDFRFTLWDSSVGGVQVAGPVAVNNVNVTDGLFTTAIDFGVSPFNGENRFLQIEVRSPAGGGAFTTINRRQLLSATPYALQTRGLFTDAALNVGVGGTPTTKLDVFGDATFRNRALFASGTTPVITTGMNNVVDKRMWMSHSTSFPDWGIQYRDITSDGLPGDAIEFVAGNATRPRAAISLSTGTMNFYDGSGSAVNNKVIIDTSTDGGLFDLYNSAGLRTVRLDGSESATFPGGVLNLFNRNGNESIQVLADGGGYGGTPANPSSGVTVRRGNNAAAQIATTDDGGIVRAFSTAGSFRATMYANRSATGGGGLTLLESSGGGGVELRGQNSTTNNGGYGVFFQDIGTAGVEIEGSEANGQGGQINLYRADGTATISIDADFNGDGRIITQELQITGGSDLSEQFDIAGVNGEEVKPGMLVSIDPKNPGALIVSTGAYDKTVAGIISGAGGVKTGLMMGQKDTKADGKYAVALTGRVYCYVDATEQGIEPGDLLTSSATAGYAMKACDSNRSQGTVIGKAMTTMAKGEKGLVLVLVNLQ